MGIADAISALDVACPEAEALMDSLWGWLFAAFMVLVLSVWLVIGNVLAVEAICSAPHWTMIGKAAMLTLLAVFDCLAVGFIVCGPLDDVLNG